MIKMKKTLTTIIAGLMFLTASPKARAGDTIILDDGTIMPKMREYAKHDSTIELKDGRWIMLYKGTDKTSLPDGAKRYLEWVPIKGDNIVNKEVIDNNGDGIFNGEDEYSYKIYLRNGEIKEFSERNKIKGKEILDELKSYFNNC